MKATEETYQSNLLSDSLFDSKKFRGELLTFLKKLRKYDFKLPIHSQNEKDILGLGLNK